MKVKRIWVLPMVVVALVSTASKVRADDAESILGVWVPVGVESDGTALTAEQVKTLAATLTFTISKEKITAPLVGGATEIEYRLYPETTPKGIDTTDLNGPRKGETRKAIYELKEDVFRLCVAGKDAPRPQKFATKSGEEGVGEILLTFQRKK
jgi:uncharacterized protein (TIGR03067 family)